MDLQNSENFKYYKCRNAFACDTGGMVYDTTKTDNFSCKTKSLQHTDERLSESDQSGQFENIIYIVDADTNSENKKRLLVDLTTHLDDDEFNDYEMHLHMNYEPENNKVLKYISHKDVYTFFSDEPEYSQSNNFDLQLIENKNENIQDFLNPIVDNNDNFVIEDPGYYQNSNNLNDSIDFENINYITRKGSPSTTESTFSSNNENNFQYFPVSCQDRTTSMHLNNIYKQEINDSEHDLAIKLEIDSNKNHMHKRKQTYTVKDDLFSELLDEDKNALTKTIHLHNKGKKKKLVYNKENQREKLKHQKKNPFVSLKMSSILKENKKQAVKKTKHQKQHRKEPVTSLKDAHFESTNYNNEILIYKRRSCQIDYCSSINSKDTIIQELSAVIHLNSEFTNADYLEYVQPRERVIESNMDKLVSPTVDVEFSEIITTCNMKQLAKENKNEIDYNGNEVNFQNIQKISDSKSLSSNEIVERELVLRSAYAKKLGFENYFNTSNDSVINEILFDQIFSYDKMELDTNCLNDVEIYTKQNCYLDKTFKSVSCTLLESLNEFNRFGGFIEEKKSSFVQESSDKLLVNGVVYFSEAVKGQKENSHLSSMQEFKEKEDNQSNSNFSFNFSNKSNLLGIDNQSRYNSLEYLSTMDPNNKSCASLKIKLKRINDQNNKYIIDDSNGHNSNINEEKSKITMKSVKNIDKYECYDCSIKFRTKRILKNHVSQCHKGPYDIECDICHTKFKKRSAHKKHQPWCLKNKIHKCYICSKVYCYHASLVKHLQTHMKSTKFNEI